MSDPVLPFIDTAGMKDPAVISALNQFNADLQSYLTDQASAFGLFSAPSAFSALSQQPLVASAFSQWTNQPFLASNFATIGPGTSWTVAETDVLVNRYLVVGKTLFWQLGTRTGMPITGSPSELAITLPNNLIQMRIAGQAGTGSIGSAVSSFTNVLIVVRPAGPGIVAIDRTDGLVWSTDAGITFFVIIELD